MKISTEFLKILFHQENDDNVEGEVQCLEIRFKYPVSATEYHAENTLYSSRDQSLKVTVMPVTGKPPYK